MPEPRRLHRINSLLREVISEVIQSSVKDPRLPRFVSVTEVKMAGDFKHAMVLVSVIGTTAEKAICLEVLRSAAGFIALHSSKKVDLRFFPALTFDLDESAQHHVRMESLLAKVREEREEREREEQNPS